MLFLAGNIARLFAAFEAGATFYPAQSATQSRRSFPQILHINQIVIPRLKVENAISNLRKRGPIKVFPFSNFPQPRLVRVPTPLLDASRLPHADSVEGCDIEPTDNREVALSSTCLSAGIAT
jgi:hypothetical protein